METFLGRVERELVCSSTTPMSSSPGDKNSLSRPPAEGDGNGDGDGDDGDDGDDGVRLSGTRSKSRASRRNQLFSRLLPKIVLKVYTQSLCGPSNGLCNPCTWICSGLVH